MDILNHLPLRTKVTLDGGLSATAFAAVANTRWVLTNFNLGWANMLDKATVTLWETSQTGSMANGSVFFQFMTSTTSGTYFLRMGDFGVEASAIFSRMGIMTGVVTGTFTAIFSGYLKGS
jgi:hypothetical protein